MHRECHSLAIADDVVVELEPEIEPALRRPAAARVEVAVRRVEELAGRIEEASAYCPLERLALSPQCGFATSVLGNALTFEDQRAKLRTIAETATAVWG